VEAARTARDIATSTASELTLSLCVEMAEHLSPAAKEHLLHRFAAVLDDWVVDGLEQASAEGLGVPLDQVQYHTTAVVHLPAKHSSIGSAAVTAAIAWSVPAADGLAAFDHLSAWLCDLLGSDDEPERWRRDILVGEFADLRPLRFSLRRQHGGEGLPPLLGAINLP
jgi:hypothetical protein